MFSANIEKWSGCECLPSSWHTAGSWRPLCGSVVIMHADAWRCGWLHRWATWTATTAAIATWKEYITVCIWMWAGWWRWWTWDYSRWTCVREKRKKKNYENKFENKILFREKNQSKEKTGARRHTVWSAFLRTGRLFFHRMRRVWYQTWLLSPL